MPKEWFGKGTMPRPLLQHNILLSGEDIELQH
jgi:hypothetical protein